MKHTQNGRIKSFTWITWDAVRANNMRDIKASDNGRINTFRIGLYGVSTMLYETTGTKFVDAYYTDT